MLDPGKLPVLVVEDNPADAFAIRRALADSPYQALEARTIAAARRWLERLAPAAIVLDVVLLGDESWRYLIELKQREKTHAIPVDRGLLDRGQAQGDQSRGRRVSRKTARSRAAGRGCLRRWTGDGSPTRVLVVDDEPVCRYLVRRLLPGGAFEISRRRPAPRLWRNCASGARMWFCST